MDELIRALGPVIACGIALQQWIELLGPALDALIKPHKKWIQAAVSLVGAVVLTAGLRVGILAPLGYPNAGVLDVIVTALFMISGTKGANDLLKWIGYKTAAARLALPDDAVRVI